MHTEMHPEILKRGALALSWLNNFQYNQLNFSDLSPPPLSIYLWHIIIAMNIIKTFLPLEPPFNEKKNPNVTLNLSILVTIPSRNLTINNYKHYNTKTNIWKITSNWNQFIADRMETFPMETIVNIHNREEKTSVPVIAYCCTCQTCVWSR